MNGRNYEFWQQAEHAAMVYMRDIGFRDARLSSPGADGGIDVRSRHAVAQVKAHAKPTGRPDIQKLIGAAMGAEHKLFFSLSGYTAGALDFADQGGVALFTLRPELVPYPSNGTARRLAARHTKRSSRLSSRLSRPPTQPRARSRQVSVSRRWQQYLGSTRPWKHMAIAVLILLAVYVAPAIYLVGRVAMVRAGDQLGATRTDPQSRRRWWAVIGGAAGTVILLSMVAGPAGGLVLGSVLLGVLEYLARHHELARLPIPAALQSLPAWPPPEAKPSG